MDISFFNQLRMQWLPKNKKGRKENWLIELIEFIRPVFIYFQRFIFIQMILYENIL